MNARFYSPTIGRFLTADTIVPDAANPQAHNRYTYSLGNPLVFIDPTGHRAETADQGTGGCTGQLGSSLLFECGFNPDYWDGSEIEGYTYQQIALLVLIWIDRQNICNARWIGYYNMLDALARSDYDRYGAAAALYGTAPETFRDTILETLIDPELLLGIFSGAVAAIRGAGNGGVTDINVSIVSPIDLANYDYSKSPGPNWE